LKGFDPRLVGRYDAIIMCELCEHLRDPLRALTRVREYLKDDGRAFVTMAINLAQEDHVFVYPTVEACRSQLRRSGLHTVAEWLAPQVFLSIPPNREQNFRKGNYIAVVHNRGRDKCA
jgi:2-polyprenyl-3-methyl-5-hydroxy-6-metoxy-1,4-benzoquinol methylase